MTLISRRILASAALILASYGGYHAQAATKPPCPSYLSEIAEIILEISPVNKSQILQQQQQQQQQLQGPVSSLRDMLDGLFEEGLISGSEREQMQKNVKSPNVGTQFISDIEVRQELNVLKLTAAQTNLLLVVRAFSMYYEQRELSPEFEKTILEMLQFENIFTDKQAKALIDQLPKRKF